MLKTTISKVLASAAIALLAGAVSATELQAQEPVPLDRIVGVVGNTPITWYDLQEKINAGRQQGMQLPTDSLGLLRYARTVLDGMIDEEVLVQKAVELKVEVSDADVTNSVDRQVKSIRERFSSEQEFREQLRLAGFGTPEEYRRFLTESIRRDELQRQVIAKMRSEGRLVSPTVTEREVQEAFDSRRGDLPRRPAAVTFRQIVVNPQPSPAAKDRARAKAESILVELRRPGTDFAQIAKRESMDEGSREIGGDLGWARRGPSGFVPEFERWAFGLPVGQLSPVVETAFGFHIIRVDQRRPGEVKSRHILIKPAIDSADVERARTLADSVAGAWRNHAPFDTLTRRFHDFANKEETSLLQPFPIDSLPESYQEALRGKEPGAITVFEIPSRTPTVPKFVIAQLLTFEEGGEMRLEDLRTRIREQLQQEAGIRRLIDQLRKETYVSMRLDELYSMAP